MTASGHSPEGHGLYQEVITCLSDNDRFNAQGRLDEEGQQCFEMNCQTSGKNVLKTAEFSVTPSARQPLTASGAVTSWTSLHRGLHRWKQPGDFLGLPGCAWLHCRWTQLHGLLRPDDL